MNSRPPKYTISRHYNRFRVIRWKQVAGHREGEAVGEFSDFGTARQALYDLNGWKYPPKENHLKQKKE